MPSMVTSGAVTKRVDRLVQQGLVERTVSTTDGRGRVVALIKLLLCLED